MIDLTIQSYEKCNRKFLDFWEKNKELIKESKIKTIILNNNLSDFELQKITVEKYNFILNLYASGQYKYSVTVDYTPSRIIFNETLLTDKNYSKNFEKYINVILAFAETLD